MNKKKILFILHIPPPVHGSSIVGSYIKQSTLINDTFACHFINLGTSKFVNEIGKNPIGKISRYLAILIQVIKQIITMKPDLCYFAITAKGIGFYKDALIAFIVKLFHIKIVYHFHNKGVSSRQDIMMDHILYQLIFKHSDVILLSKYLYVDIQKYVLERNVHYCPNGIPELNRIEEKGNKSKKITLLFLSNMIVSKGIYILLDVCKLLKEKHLDFLCNIIGAETQEISNNVLIEEIKKRDLLDYVEYHGAKYGNEKLLYITLSDIFVSPTYDDCFPLTLVEAMQHSLPVISTFEGGIPDIVINGKTGFLCQQQDAQELADKIQILIEDKDLRVKMGKNGYGHYKNNFTLKHFESNLLKILSAIC